MRLAAELTAGLLGYINTVIIHTVSIPSLILLKTFVMPETKPSCCDPFECHSRKIFKGVKKALTKFIDEEMIRTGDKICTNCLSKLGRNFSETVVSENLSTSSQNMSEQSSSESSNVHSEDDTSLNISASSLTNRILPLLGQTPVKKGNFLRKS